MRRTDRLFELMQIFRGGRFHRGRDIAEVLGVSLRTIYRDIDTLVASGVAIEGERGVGFLLREPIFLPPLNLTALELEAFHLGMTVVRQSADAELSEAAESLRLKVDAVLPSDLTLSDHGWATAIYSDIDPASISHLPLLRNAIADRQVLQITYLSLSDEVTKRRVRPLQVEYWGQVWTCTTWCELRCDFRVFRIDRLRDCTPTGDIFQTERGKSLADYLDQVAAGDR